MPITGGIDTACVNTISIRRYLVLAKTDTIEEEKYTNDVSILRGSM